MEGMPDDAAVRGYLPGKPISDQIEAEAAKSPDTQEFKNFSDSFGDLRYVAFSSAAEDDGVSVQAAYETSKEMDAPSYDAELDSTLPAGALLYLSFGDIEQNFDRVLKSAEGQSPELRNHLEQLQQALGFDLKDNVLPLFSQEGALGVYGGGQSVPEIVLALRVDEEDKATRLINRLAAIAGSQVSTYGRLGARRTGEGSPTRRTTHDLHSGSRRQGLVSTSRAPLCALTALTI